MGIGCLWGGRPSAPDLRRRAWGILVPAGTGTSGQLSDLAEDFEQSPLNFLTLRAEFRRALQEEGDLRTRIRHITCATC